MRQKAALLALVQPGIISLCTSLAHCAEVLLCTGPVNMDPLSLLEGLKMRID